MTLDALAEVVVGEARRDDDNDNENKMKKRKLRDGDD